MISMDNEEIVNEWRIFHRLREVVLISDIRETYDNVKQVYFKSLDTAIPMIAYIRNFKGEWTQVFEFRYGESEIYKAIREKVPIEYRNNL